MRIVAIQIAAGLSSRMKGPNKLLQELSEGRSMVQYCFQHLIASTIDEVIVVTGRDDEAIRSAIEEFSNDNYKIALNKNFELGMTSSIQTGLRSVSLADAVMVCLSDMPLLTSDHYNRLIEHWRKDGDPSAILAPYHQGIKGNPVIFGSAHFQSILDHQEMRGCSSIIKTQEDHVIAHETRSDAYFYDIDTPEMLKEFKSRVK